MLSLASGLKSKGLLDGVGFEVRLHLLNLLLTPSLMITQ
jgi:hypothetical protein